MMSNMDLSALKSALADVSGIDTLSQTNVGGRMVFGWNGLIAAVDPSSTIEHVIEVIRKAAADKALVQATFANPVQIPTPMPAPQPQPKATNMSTPAPGGFAASLKAMMDEARAGVTKARADGLAMVQEAVGKLNDAKTATAHVTSSMAKTIEDEAASVMSELGQISNDLTGASSS